MCDNDSRTPFDKFVEGLLNNKFAFVIEITCRLVKNNERRIFEKYARNADALFLSAAEFDSSFADVTVVSVGKFVNKLVRTRSFCRFDDFLSRCVGFAVGYVFRYRPPKQINVLKNDTYILSERM